MKKYILFLVTLFGSLVCFAQMKVDSKGSVEITGKMVIGDDDNVEVTMAKEEGIKVFNHYDSRVSGVPSDVIFGTGYIKAIANSLFRVKYETFSVKTDGTIYTSNGVIQTSDENAKENIKTLAFPMETISALRGVSFDYASKPVIRATNIVSDSALMKEYGAETIEIAHQMKSEENRKRIGLIAQEVENVLPDVVRTLPDGHKGILYSDLIGVLVEGLKEVQDSLTSQARQIQALTALLAAGNVDPSVKKAPTSRTSSNEDSKQIISELFQNLPNPFTEATEIKYRIPENVQSAMLYIYNMNGKQIEAKMLHQRGDGKITLKGSSLEAGMYFYALVVDGKQIDVKRMMLIQ